MGWLLTQKPPPRREASDALRTGEGTGAPQRRTPRRELRQQRAPLPPALRSVLFPQRCLRAPRPGSFCGEEEGVCEETPAKAVGPTRAGGGEAFREFARPLHLTNGEAEVVMFLKALQSKLVTDPEWGRRDSSQHGGGVSRPDSPEETEALT